MYKSWQRSVKAWKGVKLYLSECVSDKAVTFFSEGRPYFSFLDPVIRSLPQLHSAPIYYITSDEDDPYLLDPPTDIKAYFIGKGAAMIYLFSSVRSGTMVMTMPDLNNYHIKRSANPLHYVYIFHSIVSTHMVYREGAFDHFDTLLCVGPHHQKEVRAWEKRRGLPKKNLENHGYGPIDLLMASKQTNKPTTATTTGSNILVAPSWGPEALLETVGYELIATLLAANHKVTVRPHPRTQLLSPKRIESLSSHFSSNRRFHLELDTSGFGSFLEADLMVSDWSGAAMEFSLGLQKPVLFVDVPPKVNNNSWSDISLEPLEVFYRKDVGEILIPSELNQAPQMIAGMLSNNENVKLASQQLRDQYIFNLGRSGHEGARIIHEIAQNPQNSSIY